MSLVLTQSVLSRQLVRVPVNATSAGVDVSLTGDTVEMAFTASGVDPVSGDWKSASWDSVPLGGFYFAQCLVGPGGTVALAVGVYDVWVRVTDSPEIPVLESGKLRIT